MLANSGYYLDPTMLDRFADRALLLIRRTVGFELASRLAPYLGRNLALTVGVLVAWIRSLFRKPYFVNCSFVLSLLFFVGVAAAMSAGACIRLNRRVHPRLLGLLDVAGELGGLNAFRLIYDLFGVGRNVVNGRFVGGRAELGTSSSACRASRRSPKNPSTSSRPACSSSSRAISFCGSTRRHCSAPIASTPWERGTTA